MSKRSGKTIKQGSKHGSKQAHAQVRRSISVRGATYDSLKHFCDAEARSMSDIVEEQLARFFTERSGAHLTGARPIRSASQSRAVSGTVGRPAPTPASAVVPPPPRGRGRLKSGDYRALRF